MDYQDCNNERLYTEYRQLLLNLKSTAEGLFLSQVCNVWNVYGGLNRLHSAVESIFKHGTRVYKPDGSADCWLFIEGLNWLNPSLENSLSVLNEIENSSNIPYSRIKNDKSLIWIYRCLENHTLSQRLSWLVSDKKHLASCFEKYAFLCQEKYSEATLICLRAIERNQPELITEVDPILFLNRTGYKQLHKSHRRCSSFPEFVTYQKIETPTSEMGNKNSAFDINYGKIDEHDTAMAESVTVRGERKKHTKPKRLKRNRRLKSWGSLPCLKDEDKVEIKSREKSNNIAIPNKEATPFHLILDNTDEFKNIPKINYALDDISIGSKSRLDSELFFSAQKSSASSVTKHNLVVEGYNFENMSAESSVCKNNKEKSTLSHDFQYHKPRCSCSLPNQKLMDNLSQCDEAKQTRSITLTETLTLPNNHVKIVDCDDIKIYTDEKFAKKELNIEDNKKIITRPNDLNLQSKTWENDSEKCDTLIPPKKRISILPHSAPELLFLPKQGEKIQSKLSKKTFIEDGGSSVLPMATGFFPRPSKGQSLMSFLTSSQFSRANAELDRENAHFSISEAIIAAIEQIKCNSIASCEDIDESDEEINSLKQRIRIRRRQRLEERNRVWATQLLSDGKTDTTTESVSPLTTSSSEDSDISSMDMELEASCGLSDFHGLSVSLGSLYSDGDLSRHAAYAEWGDANEHILSAEEVALCLISKFSDKQLPRASDLEWLVSEQDAPQQLLPMPGSWPVNPDTQPPPTPLRGTNEWAPPRPQVIFTPHPPPSRKQLMSTQHYRCAGCAMRVNEQYAHRFRYCEYLGKYHCTGCHNNQLSIIPGRVLSKWDFSRCPVSNFSYRLLDRMWNDPLFRVGSVAPTLYGKSRPLSRAKLLRQKMVFLKDFIMSCRFAESLHETLRNQPTHLFGDIDVWSMADFTRVKSGEMNSYLKDLILFCENHVKSCELCQARGFVCEVCTKGVIFPWQDKVSRCDNCGSCYHSYCWNPKKNCQRCIRLNLRQQR